MLSLFSIQGKAKYTSFINGQKNIQWSVRFIIKCVGLITTKEFVFIFYCRNKLTDN